MTKPKVVETFKKGFVAPLLDNERTVRSFPEQIDKTASKLVSREEAELKHESIGVFKREKKGTHI